MTPDQAALLRKAHSSLHAAKLLAGEKLFGFAVSRTYYTIHMTEYGRKGRFNGRTGW